MKRYRWILALGATLLPLGLALAPLHAAPEKEAEKAPLVNGLKDLRQLNQKMVDLAGKATSATVSLIGGRGAGSGVVVSSDGLILSAAHVVSALGDEVTVLFPDGKRAKAKPLGADFDRDAAMLKITEPGQYPYVDVADDGPPRINDWCVALGHPGGFDPTRTPPLRLGRALHNGQFLITDCAVVGGDSGGPLFNADGEVVGIHSNIGMTLSQNRHVPIAVFQDQWDDLIDGKRHGKQFNTKALRAPGVKIDPERPVLGVQLDTESDAPVKVTGVMDNSPAAKAGFKDGDVITQLNGKPVESARQFIETVGKLKPGRQIKLTYQRDGETKETRAKLARYRDLVKPDPAGGKNPGDKNDPAKKDGGARKKSDTKDAKKDLEAFLDKTLKNAKGGKLRLKLPPADVERFGGMGRIMERLKERIGKGKGVPKGQLADRKKDEPKPKGENKKVEAPQDSAAKLLEDALKSRGRLKLTPKQVEELGGLDNLLKQLKSGVAGLDPKLLRQLQRGMTQMGPDDFYLSSMKALEPVARKTAGSTLEVLADDKPVAFGTAVSAGGWILTKDTETRKGEISVRSGGITMDATLVRRFPQRDLALFQIDAGKLRPVQWKKSPDSLPLGSLLTFTDTGGKPAGIGLVSVKTRALGQIGFLGVLVGEADAGVLAKQVVKGGPAAKAGLRDGDVITKVDDQPSTEPIEFTQRIRNRKAGETVRLELLRDGKKQPIEVKLGLRPQRKTGGRLNRMNRMSGPMSEKTGGFPRALQHDIPIEPSQCGGPLLDLDGQCVGINVSRAGRVKTLAIPAAEVAELLGQVRAETSGKPAAEIPPRELEDISETLQELQHSLKALEQRLKKIEAH